MLRLVVEDQPPGPPAVPHPRECFVCFVDRMVMAHGCSNRLQWLRLWRGRAAPRATALERRLAAKGACCCDCEILLNAYVRRADAERLRFRDWEEDPLARPREPPPPCLGVGRGSAKPCGLWVARPRPRAWW